MNEPRPRLLFLEGAHSDRLSLDQSLNASFEITRVREIEEALHIMREQRIDAVFADVGDFLPLERGLASGHAAMVLNALAEGVCICNTDGGIAWQNQSFSQYVEAARSALVETCTEAIRAFEKQLADANGDLSVIRAIDSRKFTAQVGGDLFFELAVSPVISNWPEGQPSIRQVVAIISDVSAARKLQRTLDAIDHAGAQLVRIESDVIKRHNAAERLRLLEDKIMRYTREILNFDHFAIRLLDRASNRLELVIAVGLTPEAMDIEMYGAREGNGISGYVAATGRSYICYDVSRDKRYIAGLANAGSSLTVPLRLFDRVIGIFNIESEQVGQFTEDDRQLAEIFARYMAMALHILDLLVVERYTTNERVTGDLSETILEPLVELSSQLQELRRRHLDAGDGAFDTHLEAIQRELQRVEARVGAVTRGPRTILDAEDALHRIEVDHVLVGKRILVVEDEEIVREQATKVLSALGCSVTSAGTGQEAIEALAGAHGLDRFDLVLSDIRLPDRNGYEVFSAAKRASEDMPVILMTGFGYDPHHSIVRASQEGLQCVLFKPFQADQLLHEVRCALDPASAARAKEESQQ
ncbi:MAG: response regulator [Phycisphaerales bacterium JB038]